MKATKNIKKLAVNKDCTEIFNRVLNKPEHEGVTHQLGGFIFRFFSATKLQTSSGEISEVNRIHFELLHFNQNMVGGWTTIEEGFRKDFYNFLERLDIYAEYKSEFRNCLTKYCQMLEMIETLPEQSSKQTKKMKI
ncbi:TPA: hypothetical protein QDB06_000797 [Burkholderia vietnamiensis]|nr:hypothetical protein [Burkholderia vietnamiensis]